MTSNDLDTRDKAILDAIERLRGDFDKRFEEIKLENQQLKSDLDKRFDKLDTNNERMEGKINNLSEKVSEVKGELTKFTVIENRLNDISGRVNFQGNWFLVVISFLVGGLLTFFTKLTFFN